VPIDLTISDHDHAVFALETEAMHRWLAGDPSGFLEISAPDVVYTDPFQPGWLIGLAELTAVYESIRGQLSAASFAFECPRVMEIGDAAVLTFNFTSWSTPEPDDAAATRWHCTEVYRRSSRGWQIVATHWSFAPTEDPAAG
jgi:uncharacterized protein (TIGR02246 family)